MSKLDEVLLREFGVDTFQLAEECKDIVGGGVSDEYEKEIQACATAIVISMKYGDAQGWWGAALTLFAIGYKAGKNAPDLSVFEDALGE